jgi:aquaporin Z
MTLASALCLHWPEYLIEGWALGCLMICVGLSASVLESPKSWVYTLIPSASVRGIVLAFSVGLTLTLLIQSPWGKRSGAHMNPAITLAFLRQNKIRPSDAIFYILAQVVGGTLGVVALIFLVGGVFTDPPVHYAMTMPGAPGDSSSSRGKLRI